MDIQSVYYEAGIILFWLLFAYLFMDKFLLEGSLARFASGRHAAAWHKPCGTLPDGSTR